MNVVRIMAFLRALRSYDNLAEYDRAFLKQLNDKFVLHKPEERLNMEHLQWIKAIFSARWNLVVDIIDYTIDDTHENGDWISLACDLSGVLKINPMNILSPTMKNTFDPNDSSSLADIPWRYRYIGEDKKTLYSINGVMDIIRRKLPFRTYNSNKDAQGQRYRALSINELIRISKKKSPASVAFEGKNYANFIDCLIQNIAPGWAKEGQLPKQELDELIKCIEVYFLEKNKKIASGQFVKKLHEWASQLHKLPIKDVHCFYGQTIEIGAEKSYFFEVLLHCMQSKIEDTHSHLLGIVRWLFMTDPSFFSKFSAFTLAELSPLFAELHVGSFFGVDDLKSAVLALPVEHDDVRLALSILSDKLSDKKTIDDEVVSLLASVYEKYGSHIKYKLKEEGPWIRLAQILSGAKLIPPNYYSFLIPSIKMNDEDSINYFSVTYKSLSEYILSDDETMLIDVGNCVRKLKVSGIFSNCYPNPPLPFTEREKERICFSNYERYRALADDAEDKATISRATVMAVFLLIEGSLNAIGLMLGKEYTPDQLCEAGKAYHNFYNFLKQLDPDEKKRLFEQRIFFNARNYSFQHQLNDAEKYECVATCGQYFAQMVMDYDPTLRFKADLEQKAGINMMRQNSRKKIYHQGDSKDAKLRIQLIAVILMRYYLNHEKAIDSEKRAFLNDSPYDVIFSQEIITQIESLICKLLPIYSDSCDFLLKEKEINALVTDLLNACNEAERKALLFELSMSKVGVNDNLFHSISARFISYKLAVLGSEPPSFWTFFGRGGITSESIQKAFSAVVNGVHKNIDVLMTSIETCINNLEGVDRNVKIKMIGFIKPFLTKIEPTRAHCHSPRHLEMSEGFSCSG